MSAFAVMVWYLVVITPVDGAGRQVGPFYTAEACATASAAYHKASWREAICVTSGGKQ